MQIVITQIGDVKGVNVQSVNLLDMTLRIESCCRVLDCPKIAKKDNLGLASSL
jgi:hypothetical protein